MRERKKYAFYSNKSFFSVVFDYYYIHNEFHEHHSINIWDFECQQVKINKRVI